MRWYTRIVFGLNALYQLAVGGMALFTPKAMLGMYGVAPEAMSAAFLTITRGFGGLILVTALISAFIAWNPEKHPALLPTMGGVSVFTIVAWGISLAAGDMTMDQALLDLIVQPLLIAAVVGSMLKARKAPQAAAAPAAPAA